MIPRGKVFAKMDNMTAYRHNGNRSRLSSPEGVKSTHTSVVPTTSRTEWADARHQVDCLFMAGGFNDDSIDQTAITPGPFMSFSPIRLPGGGPAFARKPAYPSQQVNHRAAPHSHHPHDARMGTTRPPLLCVEDNRKLPSIPPMPCLPPPIPVRNLSNQFVVEEVTSHPEAASFMNQGQAKPYVHAKHAVKDEFDQMDENLNTINYAYPTPQKSFSPDSVNGSVLSFDFDESDVPAVDMSYIPNDDTSLLIADPRPHGVSAPSKSEQNDDDLISSSAKECKNKSKRLTIRVSRSNNRNDARASKSQKSAKGRKAKNSTVAKTATATAIITPAKVDILRGRGGLTNRHQGNMRFRDEARKLRSDYRDSGTSRQEKYNLSKELVKKVKEYGGRFLEKGADGLWYEMDEKNARKKASQVLREEKWD